MNENARGLDITFPIPSRNGQRKNSRILTYTKIEIHIITETTFNQITVSAINYVFFLGSRNILSTPNVISHLIKEI